MVSSTNIVRGCLIVNIPSDLCTKTIEALKKDILAHTRNNGVIGMIMDYSAVRIMDYLEFERLNEICEMVNLLGPEAVIAGLQPGAVASLIDMNVDTGSFKFFLNMEQALDFFDSGPKNTGHENNETDSHSGEENPKI